MDSISDKMKIIASSIIVILIALLYLIWIVFYPVALTDAQMVDSPVLLIVIPTIFGLMTLLILLFLYLVTRNVFDEGYRDRKARESMTKQKKLFSKIFSL